MRRPAFTVAVTPVFNSRPSRLNVLKPGRVTVTTYVPGASTVTRCQSGGQRQGGTRSDRASPQSVGFRARILLTIHRMTSLTGLLNSPCETLADVPIDRLLGKCGVELVQLREGLSQHPDRVVSVALPPE